MKLRTGREVAASRCALPETPAHPLRDGAARALPTNTLSRSQSSASIMSSATSRARKADSGSPATTRSCSITSFPSARVTRRQADPADQPSYRLSRNDHCRRQCRSGIGRNATSLGLGFIRRFMIVFGLQPGIRLSHLCSAGAAKRDNGRNPHRVVHRVDCLRRAHRAGCAKPQALLPEPSQWAAYLRYVCNCWNRRSSAPYALLRRIGLSTLRDPTRGGITSALSEIA